VSRRKAAFTKAGELATARGTSLATATFDSHLG
jgi:hypothetical protein